KVSRARRRPPSKSKVELPFETPGVIRRKRREEAGEYSPERGDWVDHKRFGLCRVEKASGEGELLIRLETGRRKQIKLDYMDVLEPREDGKRRIFPLRPKRR